MSTDFKPQLPQHIDSTMLSAFKSCHKKMYLEFLQGYRPPGLSPHLHAGGCFAKAIEVTYREVWMHNQPLREALLKAHAAFAMMWGDYEPPVGRRIYKTFDRTWTAVEEYFNEYPPLTDHIQPYFASDGQPTFEYTFAIPLEPTSAHYAEGVYPLHPNGDPFLYTGRIDMLGEYMGRTVARDEKTASGIGPSWAEQWDLRSQFIGYTWALQQLGIDCDTVCVRGVAILKEEIKFAEAIKTYSQVLTQKWREQVRRDIWKLKECWDSGYWDYNLGESCTSYGGCPFPIVCTASPDSEASWLGTFERRFWNPLQQNPEGGTPNGN